MYLTLKKILILVTTLSLAVYCLWYIYENQPLMLEGETQQVFVHKSNINLKEELATLANKNHIILAKQIRNNNGKNSTITYSQIGSGSLPRQFPVEKNKQTIQNSPDDTIYTIVGKGLTAAELTRQLNSLGNESVSFYGDWRFDIISSAFTPEYGLTVLIICATFVGLLLADYVSKIKRDGIMRLAGFSKKRLAFGNQLPENLFILTVVTFSALLASAYLLLTHLFYVYYIEILCLTLFTWGLALVAINLLFSTLLFYVLQRQAINLSIKGKAPIALIAVVIVVFQAFSILASTSSLSSLNKANQQLSLLYQGQQEWAKNKEYFGLTTISANISDYTGQNFRSFVTDLLSDPNTLLAGNNLNNQLMASQTMGQSSHTDTLYTPTMYENSNIIYVNQAFIKKSGLKLSAVVQQEINNLDKENNQDVLLIPESQKNKASLISNAWQQDQTFPGINLIQSSALYSGGSHLFVYSSFGNNVNNQSFVTDPLIMVYGTKTFDNVPTQAYTSTFMNYVSSSQILVTNPDKLMTLVKKYSMEHAIGSSTNGYASISSRIVGLEANKDLMLAANFLSAMSALLLITLLNTIYLYQNRRKTFIERLAGKSLLSVHGEYLWAVFISMAVIVVLASFVLHVPLTSLIVPLIYLVIIYSVFAFQAWHHNKANILYLKGE